jgi:hypothetical protein
MHAGDKGAFFIMPLRRPLSLLRRPDFATRETQKKTRVTLMEKFLIFSPVKVSMFWERGKCIAGKGVFMSEGAARRYLRAAWIIDDLPAADAPGIII